MKFMDWRISDEELAALVKHTRSKEDRRFANDSWAISVYRYIFVKWMKSKGLWGDYMRYHYSPPKRIEHIVAGQLDRAWINPSNLDSFLGNTSFGYNEAYIPWLKYCKNEDLEGRVWRIINKVKNE